MGLYELVIAGLMAFAVSTDKVSSNRRDAAQAKACGDARKADATETELANTKVCEGKPSQQAPTALSQDQARVTREAGRDPRDSERDALEAPKLRRVGAVRARRMVRGRAPRRLVSQLRARRGRPWRRPPLGRATHPRDALGEKAMPPLRSVGRPRALRAPGDLGWLGSLRPAARRAAVQRWHASPRNSVWGFVTADDAGACVHRQRAPIGLVGHTDVAAAWHAGRRRSCPADAARSGPAARSRPRHVAAQPGRRRCAVPAAGSRNAPAAPAVACTQAGIGAGRAAVGGRSAADIVARRIAPYGPAAVRSIADTS